jgi:UDP-glucose 4-epimerase
VVPAFLDAALHDQPVTVHGDGEQTRDFTYVGTLCDVMIGAVSRRVTSDTPVNLAFGTRNSLLDLLTEIEGVIGRPVAREHVEPRAGDVRDSQADNSRLRELFPEVRPVSLRSGLSETVEWFGSRQRSS